MLLGYGEPGKELKRIFTCEGIVNDGSDDSILNSPITTQKGHIYNAINSLEEHNSPCLDSVSQCAKMQRDT